MTALSSALVAPIAWGETLPAAPVLDRPMLGLVPGLVRRWRDIAPDIDQSALDHHYLSVHLGGAKRLVRSGEGSCQTRDVPSGAHSVIPSEAAFRWQTEGPIDFAHIYFRPEVVDHLVASAFDRDPAQVRLEESLGVVDPLIATLASELLGELAEDHFQQAYVDDIAHLLLCRVLRLHSNARACDAPARHVLAPFRLRRAIEFMTENLGRAIGVTEIADASGVSQFHFSRAFRQTTGRSPYAYLLDRRIDAARRLLTTTALPMTAIAKRCGFGDSSQFARIFRRATRLSPTQFRDRH